MIAREGIRKRYGTDIYDSQVDTKSTYHKRSMSSWGCAFLFVCR